MSTAVSRVGTTLFRLRSITPLPVIAFLAWQLFRTRESYGPGGPTVDAALNVLGVMLCLAGQTLRFFTLAQVPDGTSGQDPTLEARSLNRHGPYAYVRNPLYVGNLGICLGLMLIANEPWAYVLGLGFFFGEYFFIIRAEESFLRAQFGATYDEFVARVPRWIPRLTPAYPPSPRRLNFERALKKEHNPFAAWATGALVLLAWEAAGRAQLSPAMLRALGLCEALVLASFVLLKAYKRGWILRR